MPYVSSLRFVSALGAASLLAACAGGSASAPALPGVAGTQAASVVASSTRAVDDHGKTKSTPAPTPTPEPKIMAAPASLEFTADQAAAGTAQTVIVSARDEAKLHVSIAGTGNCPTVTPEMLKPRHGDGDGDRDDKNAKGGAITVTPNGAGPATCIITVTRAHGGGHDDGDHDGDRDGRHGGNGRDCDRDETITIPVIVDAGAVPSPTPVATPTPVVR